MWTIGINEILALRGPGGDRFTAFVDDLIRAHAFRWGVAQSEILTNLRTDIPDGGVDTEVRRASISDPLGWMEVKTIWQYKATSPPSFSKDKNEGLRKGLREELSKPSVKERLEAGFGYRLCYCANLTAEDKGIIERVLAEIQREVAPHAPPPRTLAVADFKSWIEVYPALILRWGSQGPVHGLHWRAWEKNITAETKSYVFVPQWRQHYQAIREHLQFDTEPGRVVLTVQGEAGAGKTRAVFEAINKLDDQASTDERLRHLVVYVRDERAASTIAHRLANDASLSAIVIADECSLRVRLQLEETLKGHRSRVRVVALDNQGWRSQDAAVEIWLEQMSSSDLEKVLAENFQSVGENRRVAYASMARGYVRFAVWLCREDDQTLASTRIQDLLRDRLSEKQLKVLQALALFSRVGFRDDVTNQLVALCEMLGEPVEPFGETVRQMLKRPGFIARAGRFYYVTPGVVAQIAFRDAWRRWAQDQPFDFLARIPNQLLVPFNERVRSHAEPDVRQIIADYFHHRANEVTLARMQDPEVTRFAVELVELEPERYVAWLRQLVETAPLEEIEALPTSSPRGAYNSTPPRRQLVWLAERLAAFPEYFAAAEAMLLRLALAETESGLSNNATRLWCQLYRVFLSGTATPFDERLADLTRRLTSDNPRVGRLALEAFGELLDPRPTRLVGKPVFAGRVPPDEWSPATQGEGQTCVMDALEELRASIERAPDSLREQALEMLIDKAREILGWKALSELETIIELFELTNRQRTQLRAACQGFLAGVIGRHGHPGYQERVEVWAESLRPREFRAHVLSLVEQNTWELGPRDRETFEQDIIEAADTLSEDSEALEALLPALSSPRLLSVGYLGHALGVRREASSEMLARLVQCGLEGGSMAFARGYLAGLLEQARDVEGALNALVDTLAKTDPKAAYELYSVGGERVRSLERTIGLVQQGCLSLHYLKPLMKRLLSRDEIARVLTLVKTRDARPEDEVFMLNQLHYQQWLAEKEGACSFVCDERLQPQLWSLLERTLETPETHDGCWSQLLVALGAQDIERMIELALEYIISRNVRPGGDVNPLFDALCHTGEHTRVLSAIGERIDAGERHDPEMHAIRSELSYVMPLLLELPLECVTTWLEERGLQTVGLIAHHVPRPSLDEEDAPQIHPLTEHILTRYAASDDVFQSFVAGPGFRVYRGWLSDVRAEDARVAEAFLNHHLRRVNEWARHERLSARQDAERARLRDEEERELGLF